MTYLIHEDNLNRLEKKLETIERKCRNSGITFIYEKVRDVYKDIETSEGIFTTRFIEVYVEGTYIIDDWEFVAVIDYTDNGNVIRKFREDCKIPQRYKGTSCICEHCNTRRNRKETYLIHNTVSDDWKQVGKSCLQLCTHGLSAEVATNYISFFDEIMRSQEPNTAHKVNKYFSLYDLMYIASECVNKFGYCNSSCDYSTKDRVLDIIYSGQPNYLYEDRKWELKEELDDVHFNSNREENIEFCKDAISWARNLSDNIVGNSEYLYNLKTVCMSDYILYKHVGVAVSLVSSYRKELKRIKELEDMENKQSNSTHQGNIGERIEFDIESIEIVNTSYSAFGLVYLYSMLDTKGNVYIWFTSKGVDCEPVTHCKGTVKAHDQFRGINQTVVTRCKLT